MQVRLLIQQAYRDAQIIAEEGENASATQLNSGLRLFNRRVRKISIDGWEIPLITEETTTLPAGVTDLELSGWSKLLKAQYLQGEVKLPITLLDYNTFLDNAVITNSTGIPYTGYQKRTPSGITLKVFFNPNEDYTIFLSGYKSLAEATLETDLSDVEGFLQDYLSYQLSYDLQVDNQLQPSPTILLEIKQYEAKLQRLKVIRVDRIPKNVGSGGDSSIAAISLGRGWRV